MGRRPDGKPDVHDLCHILATEIGLSAESITIEEGDTDTAPHGLRTYGSRSTPVAGADAAILTDDAKPQIGGKLAQLGSRLIQSTAKNLVAKLFKCFADLLEAEKVG